MRSRTAYPGAAGGSDMLTNGYDRNVTNFLQGRSIGANLSVVHNVGAQWNLSGGAKEEGFGTPGIGFQVGWNVA
jgi:hypothetical protein